MRRQFGLIAMCVGVLGLAVLAGEKPPEAYVKDMKATNAALKSLKDNVDAKNWEGVAKDGATLKTLFEATQAFWEKRKAEDAIGAAKTALQSAADLEKAGQARDEQRVLTAQKTLGATCKTCHDAHRERLQDGTSEIK